VAAGTSNDTELERLKKRVQFVVNRIDWVTTGGGSTHDLWTVCTPVMLLGRRDRARGRWRSKRGATIVGRVSGCWPLCLHAPDALGQERQGHAPAGRLECERSRKVAQPAGRVAGSNVRCSERSLSQPGAWPARM
jgi:hypothetical protein